MAVSREELILWVFDTPPEISAKLKLVEEDLRGPFEYLLENTKGISKGLHNAISPRLKKAFEDPRSLAQQVHDEVGDIMQWGVEFDAPEQAIKSAGA